MHEVPSCRSLLSKKLDVSLSVILFFKLDSLSRGTYIDLYPDQQSALWRSQGRNTENRTQERLTIQ